MNATQKYEAAYAVLRKLYAKRAKASIIRRAEKMVHILSNRMYEANWASNKVTL